MCNANCIIFGANNLSSEEIKDKKVIEVGAYNLNGSLQKIIKKQKPSEYIGVDIEIGPGVDIVCNIEDLVNKFGENSFDLVISTELLEHVKDWHLGISNLKKICRPGGIILITTRSFGFSYHSYPFDYWRYEVEDMNNIFSDFEILSIEKDPQDCGVFVKVRKKENTPEKDLSDFKLYNIISDKRVLKFDEKDLRSLRYIFISLKEKLKRKLKKLI